MQQRRPVAGLTPGDAHTVGRRRVSNGQFHWTRLIATHYAPRTAYTRIGSPTPFISCSQRSSNSTPAAERAIPRTKSDTKIFGCIRGV